MDLVLPGGASLFGSTDYMDSTNTAHPNATEDDLINALAAMERGDIEFVILRDNVSKLFMQTTGNPVEGYYLEYNDGVDDVMFRARGDTLSGLQITDALTAFLNHDSAWRAMF
ncbi:MAG: hypothetical protein BroJett039_08050 [Chloroflexota bacterium]|nr:MAG: hypothetical protein BroJett039_08050 [Chloroflexota bacterium]